MTTPELLRRDALLLLAAAACLPIAAPAHAAGDLPGNSVYQFRRR